MEGHTSINRFYVVVERAPDVPGQWTAHVLDIDVVTQGNSFAHVLQMAAEASAIVVHDDLVDGRDPSSRRAPEEFFEDLKRRMLEGKPCMTSAADLAGFDDSIESAVAFLELRVPVPNRSTGDVRPIAGPGDVIVTKSQSEMHC